MGNRKLQFAVTRLQFQVAEISNFRKAFIVYCSVPPFFFGQVEVHHFYRPKNRNNSLIEVQKFNKHMQTDIKKLVRAFKREAVQFLMAKNLTVNHLPLEALPAVQT